MATTPQIAHPQRRIRFTPYVWILPAAVILAVFLFYPIFQTTALSFFEWNGFMPDPFAEFVGPSHYIELTQDKFMGIATKNTFLFVLAMTTVELFIAFVLAVFIFQAQFRGAAWLRGILFFPSVLSAIVVGIIWRNIVFLREGLIDQLTTAFGLPDFFPLGDIDLAFPSIIVVAIWQNVGFNLIIFYAGLQSLDNEVLESAQIDGASFWQLIIRIIAPLQRPVILVSIILNFIGGIKVFDLVFSMSASKGVNPLAVAHVTDVFATYMNFNSFGGGPRGSAVRAFGYAASIAVVMMVVSIVFAFLRQRLRRTVDI